MSDTLQQPIAQTLTDTVTTVAQPVIDSTLSLGNQFTSALPKIAGAIALLLGGWILAKVLERLIRKALEAIKIDKLAARLDEIDLVRQTNLSIRPSIILSKTIYYVLLLLFIVAASDSLNMPVVSKQISNIVEYTPKLISAFTIFILGLVVSNFLKNIVHTTGKSLNIPSARIISSAVFYFLFITISITALEQGGMNTSFLTDNIKIILAGVVLAFAIGYGVASRDMARNILAASYSRKKFAIGDRIQFEDVIGEIVELDSTTVTIETENGEVLIPQARFMHERVRRFPSK